jgi:archaellum component FlaC
MKIIDKLSTYAALIGTISVIGGGFYAWGEFNTRLSAIEGTPAVNLQPLQNKDKELTTAINDNKIDLIDRIKKVEDKIQPVDLTTVFKEIGKVREEVAMINIPNIDGIKKDIKEINATITRIEKKLAILEKEKEVLAIEIEEIKLESNNPLSN